MEAPIPVMEPNLRISKKLFTNNFDIKQYKFSLSKTDNNTIIFDARIKEELATCYYELEYGYSDFTKLSELFSKCNNTDEVYKLLIYNFNKNEKNISIQKDFIELSFSLDASTNKKEEVKIYMDKKKVN